MRCFTQALQENVFIIYKFEFTSNKCKKK